MSNNQLFIPNTIKVGYNDRDDTYTGKLAYIIYIDEKGKVRKETSWNNWCDHRLGDDSYENVPTEGFVINKNVGGYSTGWNHRQSYIRVYDPRGFEFEITLENLLFIIENTSLITGKGIEGEFVYGWDGKDLVLIPCKSTDYLKIKEYNELIRSDFKLTAKTIKVGATYRNDKEVDLVYIGRYDKYENYSSFKEIEINSNEYEITSDKKGKKYWFYDLESKDFLDYSSLNKFKMLVNDEPLENTSQLMDNLLKIDSLQYFNSKNINRYSFDDNKNRNHILKIIYNKVNIKYNNDVLIFLYDKDNKIQYHLLFERNYSFNRKERDVKYFYQCKLIKHEIKLVTNSYYRKEREVNTHPMIEINLNEKEINSSDYYAEFKNYNISFEEFSNKFNELIFSNESFTKDLYYLEYVSEVNDSIRKIPLDYYLKLKTNY